MGNRSSAETIAAIIQAFLQERTWSQSDLARHVDVGVPALRKRLAELSAQGFPITREDDPPHVYWSVPRDWFPGGVAFTSGDAVELLRLLLRVPRSQARDRFMRRIIEAAPRQSAAMQSAMPALVAPSAPDGEETYLPIVEDALARRVPLAFKYFSVNRGMVEWRAASVQRVTVAPPARFLAVCHRDGALKWFRVDNVFSARLDETVDFRLGDAAQVDAIMAESLNGFHQGGVPIHCAFVVSEHEARWVSRNLLPGMAATPVPDGLRVTLTTAGILRLARWVVGLGGAVRIETPELAALVRELGRGALEAAARVPDEAL